MRYLVCKAGRIPVELSVAGMCQFRCDDHTCLPDPALVCNNIPDCLDSSDENQCSTQQAPTGKFQHSHLYPNWFLSFNIKSQTTYG